MRILCPLAALLGGMMFAGCARDKEPAPPPPALTAGLPEIVSTNAQGETVTITPDQGLGGKVASSNAKLQFVVMTFPLGRMPRMEQRLNVYRNGQKVGEVRVSGPRHAESIVADITNGEAQKGDDVREN